MFGDEEKKSKQYDVISRRVNKSFNRQQTPNFGGDFETESTVDDEEEIAYCSPQNAHTPVFHFTQYTKTSILRPIPVYVQTQEEEKHMETLLSDPVVRHYMSLPMAGCRKSKKAREEN